MVENLVVVLLQLAVILIATQVGASISVKLGMTPIMGELASGVVLGPTVFGALLPTWQKFLFPPIGTVNAQILASFFWIGLTLLMFLGGLEIEHGDR